MLQICEHAPAARQLLRRGFFPCAPIAPSLAVDMNFLDFCREHFLNTSPNVTAWAETIDSFLEARGYRVAGQVRIFFLCSGDNGSPALRTACGVDSGTP